MVWWLLGTLTLRTNKPKKMPIYFPALFTIFESFESKVFWIPACAQGDRIRWQNTMINHRHFVDVAFRKRTHPKQQHKQQLLHQRDRQQQQVIPENKILSLCDTLPVSYGEFLDLKSWLSQTPLKWVACAFVNSVWSVSLAHACEPWSSLILHICPKESCK